MSDMEILSQQTLRETDEQKMARWRREEQRDRERLIQRGVVTAEQLKELDEEFTPETVNFAILGMVEKYTDYADLRHEVDCCACIY